MNRLVASSLLCLFFMVCSTCTPQLSDSQAERITTEARQILALHPSAPPIFSPSAGTDPRYELIREGLYRYYIAG